MDQATARAGIEARYTLPSGQAIADQIHIFAVEWEPNAIRFYADDDPYRSRVRRPTFRPCRSRRSIIPSSCRSTWPLVGTRLLTRTRVPSSQRPCLFTMCAGTATASSGTFRWLSHPCATH
jgi:hypothetical protein